MHRRIAIAALLLLAPAHAEWGSDIPPGAGKRLLEIADKDLAVMTAAPAEQRAARIADFAKRRAEPLIEALKRYRDPRLKDLFLALLEHPDWRVQHRALLVLGRMRDPSVREKISALRHHPNRRIQKAARIALLLLESGEGKRSTRRVVEPILVRAPSGLLRVPWQRGLSPQARPLRLLPKKTTHHLPQALRWDDPLLGYGEEEIAVEGLRKFGDPGEKPGRLHTGRDIGACLDGAGVHAVAAGVVSFISTGTAAGTTIVIKHALGDGLFVHAVYSHLGETVFVAPGEEVSCGQLLATIGLSFSAQNGGTFAHLQLSFYLGPFDPERIGPDAPSLAGWIDPDRFLPARIEQARPLVELRGSYDRSLSATIRLIEKGKYSLALTTARKLRDAAKPGSEAHVDAVGLVGLLEQVPQKAVRKAERLRRQGYPARAKELLQRMERACRGIPGIGAIAKLEAQWDTDPLFARALAGVQRVRSALRRGTRLKDPAKREALKRSLLRDYGATGLKARIELFLR